MSAAISATAWIAAAAVTATAYTIYSGEQQRKQQNQALDMQRQAQSEAKASAEAQAKSSEEAMNKANRKTPDMATIMQQATKGGPSATMLTGAQGIDPNQLVLGKNTLLGG